jgi:hypothetical protein
MNRRHILVLLAAATVGLLIEAVDRAGYAAGRDDGINEAIAALDAATLAAEPPPPAVSRETAPPVPPA